MIKTREPLTLDSIIWFGKYKDKTVEFILNYDSNYLHWILDNNIQNIKFSESIVIPPFKRRVSISSNRESDIFGLDKLYREQRRNEYPSVEWGSDGDYYPNGCDIYGFG